MNPRKKGQMYEISYRCAGYEKPFFERYPTYQEAKRRAAQIDYEKRLGTFVPPKPTEIGPDQETPRKRFITVGELLDEYVQVYGLSHWGDSFLSYNCHRIEHYIKPYIGNIAVRDLTTHDLDVFYHSLQDKPAVILKGHKKTDATVSPSVIEKTHTLLRGALNQAVKWEYIRVNPAEHVTLPQYKPATRAVWNADEARNAIECCTDPILKLALLLALGCSMRIGEILGLTWDCVDCSEEAQEKGTAHVQVNKQLRRCQKTSLEALEKRGRSQVVFTFPERKQTHSTTALVLTAPKTQSSIRTIFLPHTVAAALQDALQAQKEHKELLGEAYHDYGLVLAHEDGRPYEERQIAALLQKLIEDHDLPPVVFHSLRHCSASLKLQIGGGNIQGRAGRYRPRAGPHGDRPLFSHFQ